MYIENEIKLDIILTRENKLLFVMFNAFSNIFRRVPDIFIL